VPCCLKRQPLGIIGDLAVLDLYKKAHLQKENESRQTCVLMHIRAFIKNVTLERLVPKISRELAPLASPRQDAQQTAQTH
jgi:hypothetical protein